MKFLKSLNGQSLTVLGAVLLASAFLLMPEMANAAGGLDTAKTQATNIRTWLYSIIGIGGGIYLLICVLRLWGDSGYRLIPDFIKSLGFVALGAGVPAMMVWLWGTFKSGWN
ncbi:MAG: hypothetical protein IKG79_09620 [Neisseriaceae bacterium]|nr:hypothetical protein [Neisseriaceae bacterium]